MLDIPINTCRPQRLLAEGLLTSAQLMPEKEVAVVEGEAHTYGELFDQSLRLAAALYRCGIRRGDRVAVFMDNTWPCIVSIYAVLSAGGVFVIVNPQTKADKLDYLLRHSEAGVLVTDGHLDNVFVPVVERNSFVNHVIYSGELKRPPSEGRYHHFASAIGESDPLDNVFQGSIPNDIAALIYTSGSTGNPKGVMMTHQAMVFACWSLLEYLQLSAAERIMNVLPLAFDYGLYQLLMTVTLGATLIVEKSFSFPADIYKRMIEEQVTVFPGVPTIFSLMVNSRRKKALSFPSVTCVTNTADRLSSRLIPELREIFPNADIFKMYGLTECKRVSFLAPELIDQKPESVGKAIPGTEVFLLSPEGEEVAAGKSGILHARGPHLMLGYWKQPELTERMLKKGKLPGERVLCTHDWFHMDEDGYLYFEGRSDDTLKVRGEKVSPAEVEDVLAAISGVKESAVIGLEDAVYGQSIVAFLVVDEDSGLTGKMVKRKCLAGLENYMVPQRVVFLSELPKSMNGKVDKRALAGMV